MKSDPKTCPACLVVHLTPECPECGPALTNAPSGLPAATPAVPPLTADEYEARAARYREEQATREDDDDSEYERAVQSLCDLIPANVGFHLDRNPHALVYEDVSTYCTHMHENGNPSPDDFQSPEDYEAACATNELWVMQLYPATPVGFVRYCASSFAKLLSYPIQP